MSRLQAWGASVAGWIRAASESAQRLPDRQFTIVAMLLAFCVYAATGAYHTQSIDVAAAEEPAWLLATRGTLDLSGVANLDLPWYFEHDGGLFSDRFPGAILFLVPGYWLAARVGVDGFSFVPGVLTAAVVAAATVGVMSSVFARVLGPRAARVATLFLAFGTGTWTISGHAPWSHTIGQFVVALTLLALAHQRDRLAALASGLLTLTRPVEAVAVLVLGSTLAWQRRSWREAAWFMVLAAPGVLLLVAYNGLLFDRWGPSNGHELGGEIRVGLADLPLNLLGTVLSPERGLVFVYPFLVLVPLGLSTAWREAQDWERSAALAGVSLIVVQLALNRYTGGDTFFGNRLVIEPLTFAAPILARSVAGVMHGPRRTAMGVLLGLGVVVHAIGATLPGY